MTNLASAAHAETHFQNDNHERLSLSLRSYKKKQFDVKEIIIIVLTQLKNQQMDPHNVPIFIIFCE